MTNIVKNNKNSISAIFAGCVMLLTATACSGPSFKVEGTVEGAADAPLVLQKADFTGTWLDIDSTRTDGNGNFSIKSPAPESPDLYRLNYDGQYIYLPVDSIETLTLAATSRGFSSAFTLSGTDQATLMTTFSRRLSAVPAHNADSLAAFKRWVLSNVVLAAQGRPTVMGYYALTCRLPQGQLFDIDNPADARTFAAVATAYQQYRPDDPRTRTLERMAIQAQRKLNTSQGRQRVLQAPEAAMIDFELKDNTGTPRRLSSVTTSGKPTILIFSVMGHEDSPAFNRAIAQLHDKYGKNMNFFMVCLDGNIAAWREQVRNIPWTCVIDPAGRGSETARAYNVTSLPAYFIFNARGELVDRASSIKELTAKIPG